MKLAKADLGSILYICRNMRQADRDEIFATRWTDDPDELSVEVMTRWGLGWVAFDDNGTPVAAIGATPLWEGVWQAWMFATDDFLSVGKQLTRWTKRVMIPSLLESGMHRAEARSSADHHSAHAWMQALGAKRESVLRRFGREKQDFFLFVWEF
jgi:hypothetical protein